MNRREAIQAGLSVLSAVGIDGEVSTISPRNPQMIVFRLPVGRRMTAAMRESMRKDWDALTAGTALEGVKAIVLEGGMSIEVIDKP